MFTMSQTQQSGDPTDSSIRPSSTRTNDSTFADSAIEMGPQIPKQPEALSLETQPPSSSDHSISDQLSHLAAAAWASEKEQRLADKRRHKIQEALKMIEKCIGEREEWFEGETEMYQVTKELPTSQKLHDSSGAVDVNLYPEQLDDIHHALRATIGSMRLRQQEQRHLNHLTLQKLESVVQTCLIQQTQLQEMAEEVRDLRIENHKLGEENERLHDRVAGLESQATQKEAAVIAMSSAVKGLEGWMNSSPGPGPYGGSPSRPTLKRGGNYIVRGKGRFRGRYYTDNPEDEPASVGLDGTSDSRELYDGVRGWLRGFRDVEEELQKVALDKPKVSENLLGSGDEDWRDFETVSDVR